MTEPALFQFEPLQDDTAQIRLLQVAGDGTYCLQSFDVDDCPPYTALSYTWGVESATKTIMMDGKRFAVRPNLYSFLQLYAIRYADQWLWVDQVQHLD